jgi:tetratricopeptide (TPR) repeat protein
MAALRSFLKTFFRRSRDAEDSDLPREEYWKANFSRPSKLRFAIERTEDYSIIRHARRLELALHRGNTLAWTEMPGYRYQDFRLQCSIGIKDQSPYAACGILFHYIDEQSFYCLLVSNKGNFRLDSVFNGSPSTLIPWTELNHYSPKSTELELVQNGDSITIIFDGHWAASIQDDGIGSGSFALAAASYEDNPATVWLDSFAVESRPILVEAAHIRWTKLVQVEEKARLNLAESFLAVGQAMPALIHIRRIWHDLERQKKTPSPVSLLLAASCALRLGLYEEAEEYLNRCIEVAPEENEGRQALGEKAKLLYKAGRYKELLETASRAAELFPQEAMYLTLQGHALLYSGKAQEALRLYTAAAEHDANNPLAMLNAANTCEQLADPDGAASWLLQAGRLYLETNQLDELEDVLLRLHATGKALHRVLGLSAKCAWARGDYARAEKEVNAALAAEEDAAKEPAAKEPAAKEPAAKEPAAKEPAAKEPAAKEPAAKEPAAKELENGQELSSPDPALPYLKGLMLSNKGKRKTALSCFQTAARLRPDYQPFVFKQAECLFLLGASEAEIQDAIEAVLALNEEDGWARMLAGQFELSRGDVVAARAHLEAARRLLGIELTVLINLAELRYYEGSADEALSILDAAEESPALHNARANLLVRMDRLEEAEEEYRHALLGDRENPEYLRNRASCLIELSRYGEADDLLARAWELDSGPATLELISWVAAKKGEYQRAEAACRAGLEIESDHIALLRNLGWIYLRGSRWDDCAQIVEKLNKLSRKQPEHAIYAHELERDLLAASTRLLSCAGCKHQWRVPKELPEYGTLRLVAEPPDDYPAGTCPDCGKHWCIGCAKEHMDEDGRFSCAHCGGRLKLLDNGIKHLLSLWMKSLPNPAPTTVERSAEDSTTGRPNAPKIFDASKVL